MLGKKLRTEDDRIKAVAKARKKKRKKMIKTKYGQKAVRHSKRGVYSCTYAVVIAFLVIVMILFSFLNKGKFNRNKKAQYRETLCLYLSILLDLILCLIANIKMQWHSPFLNRKNQ